MTPDIDDAKAEERSYTKSEDKKLEARMEASHASQGKYLCVISERNEVPIVSLNSHAGKLIQDLGKDFEEKMKVQERKAEYAVSEG